MVSFSFSSHWLPVLLYLGLGSCETFPNSKVMSTDAIITQVMFTQAHCWDCMSREHPCQNWKFRSPFLYILWALGIIAISVRVSTAVLKTMVKSQFGGGKSLFRFTAVSHHEGKSEGEIKKGTCRQEPKQKPWRNAAYRLAPHGLLSRLLIQLGTICPKMAPPIIGWSLPHQSPTKKMPHGLAYWPI